MKYSLLQVPFLLPFAAAFSAAVAYLLAIPTIHGLALGFKGCCALLSARLILLVFTFSSGTNDTSEFGLRNLLVITMAVIASLVFVGLAAAGILMPSPVLSTALCALAAIEAYGLYRAYGWLHNRMLFDLMAVPRQ